MIEKPARPAAMNDSGVLNAATQSGGVGFCVGRGSDVTLRKEWKRPSEVTFSFSSSRRICCTPSSKRARDSSRLRPKRSNSCGRQARAKPTSRRPPEMASSMPISPASFSGLLKIGRTAPVTRRARLVRCAAAARNTIGFGL